MARPARVRIRNRKPCTRARRRLFGWKVRLPLATAVSSMHLPPQSARSPVLDQGGPQWILSEPWQTRVSLVAGAVSGQCRFAAASPTFGRLFEGTDDLSPGQTWLAGPCSEHQPLAHATSATLSPRLLSSYSPGMLQNGWHSHRKLLASGNAVSDRNGVRQRSEDGGSAIRRDNPCGLS